MYENMDSKIYDIVEPKKFLYENSKLKNKITKAHNNFEDATENYYDRIISIAVLEHLEDLPWFLAKSSFKLNSSGYQSHSVPCEGYLTWNLSWSATRSIPFYLKTGQSYKKVQKHEHINNLDEILGLIKYFYKEVAVKYSYPFFTSPSLALFANITFSNPNKESIDEYLKNL
jgi:2-polyprenyl-3-methyl-5-hydroxy-6-metoxy-1,4-benzoquinol methylase